MQQLTILHALGTLTLVVISIALIGRGAKAHRYAANQFSEVFPWSRFQWVGSLPIAFLLLLTMFVLPYLFQSTSFQNYFDVVVVLALTAAILYGIVDLVNRRVVMNESCVGTITWNGGLKSVPWQDVKLVTFHDVLGGIFRMHSPRTTVSLPVQIERPLRAIQIMEDNVPDSSLDGARKGIALCRTVLGP